MLRSMSSAACPLSPFRHLLFSQVCLLCGIAGILAQRYPGPGLTLFVLVWLLDLPRTRSRSRSMCCLLAFCCAFVYAVWRVPSPPPVPAWLDSATVAGHPPGALRIRAGVESCDLLQGNRARVLLKDARPADSAGTQEPYRGNIVWNWRDPEFMLQPGEELEATVRLVKVRGFANSCMEDADAYWHDRDVWFRAWSGGRAGVVLTKESGSVSRLRRELRQRFYAGLPRMEQPEQEKDGGARLTPAAAILPALVFADRSQLTHAQSELFAKATLAHSLALSGLHLGFAVLAGTVLARGIGRAYPWLWLRISRPRLAMLLSLPFTVLYLWLGQMPVSLARAACMLAFWTLLLFLKRPKVLLDGLFVALAVILACNPQALFDISLQLSALSVAAIALCLPGLSRLSARLFPSRRHPDILAAALRGGFLLLGVSFCIQALLLPLTVRIFGGSGFLFPLNLIWLPVLGTIVLPLSFAGLFLSALGLHSLAAFALHGAALPCEALMALLSALDSADLLAVPLLPRPHWLTTAGYWLLCLVLPGFLRRLLLPASRSGILATQGSGLPGFTAFTLCGVVMVLLPIAQALHETTRTSVRLRILDVGQGQSVLLEWSGLGKECAAGRVLIDGGGFAGSGFDVGKSVVAPALTDNALVRLDMAIATHPDTDHLSGLMFIVRHFKTDRYYCNGDAPSPALAALEREALERRGLVRETLCAGDRLELAPDLKLEVLWPPRRTQNAFSAQRGKKAKEESGNNASLVLRVVWRGVPLALLCGDIETAALEGLMAAQDNGHLAARVLLLPHHGSATSLVPEFYRAVRPYLALASCGYGNRWGFPSAAVMTALRELDIPLRSTAEFGQIGLRWTAPEEKPEISFARPQGCAVE